MREDFRRGRRNEHARARALPGTETENFAKMRKILFDGSAGRNMLLSRLKGGSRRTTGCSSLRAHGRAGFNQSADRIGFCLVPEQEERRSLTVLVSDFPHDVSTVIDRRYRGDSE
jgi:hypothetical protein